MYDQFFVCRRCKIFFKTRKFRKMHNVINHRRKKKEEEIIEVKIVKPKRRKTQSEPLICDLCSKSFKIKALIRSHMNCHLSEKLHQCTQCNYASKRFNDLRKHNDVHHNPDRIIRIKRPRRRRCQECQEIFADKLALRAHKRLSHRKVVERKPKIFKTCEKCEEILYSKKSFIVHMKEKHPDTMAIKCDRCNRRFKTNFRLKKHKSRYEFAGKDCRIQVRQPGEFICQKCDSKFTLKSHLSLHMRKHQTHTCEQCKIEFKSQFSLKYHEFSHLEIEPKCSNCEKIFTSEQKFANHLKRKSCMLNGLTNGHAPEILTT